jgi:cysteine desulfurase
VVAALDVAGNPSAVHAEGRAARAVVERARSQVALAVGCQPEEVVFTSGATEAAGMLARLVGPVLVQPTAHDCLIAHHREGGEGPVTYAMGLANGETGVVSDLPEREGADWVVGGAVVRHLFLDVAQAVGRVPFAFSWSGADFAVVSGHKFGGPKGVGALIIRGGLDIEPLAEGGGQEGRRRSGTENVAGIAGLGAAAEAAAGDLDAGVWTRVAKVRNILEEALVSAASDTIVIGREGARLPNTSCLASPGWKAETQVMQMDLAGFAISAGSACSSGKVRSGRVLRAMGCDEEVAQSAIRISIGPATTEDEVLRFADAWLAAHRRFRARAA